MVSVGDDITAANRNQLPAWVVKGSSSGTISGSTGSVTITHGLAFTPSAIFPVSTHTTPVTDGVFVVGVSAITATTFTVRFAAFTLQSGANYYTTHAGLSGLAYSIDYLAVG